MAERERLAGFKIAGAHAYKGQKLKVPVLYAEDKFDGLRMVVIVRDGFALAYTRTGCLIPNARLVCAAIEDLGPAHSGVYDGEGFAEPDWNMTTKVIMTQTYDEKLAKTLVFKAFDFLRIKEWDNKECYHPLEQRKKVLKRLVQDINSKKVRYVSHKEIKADPETIESFVRVRAAQGLEGGVFKNPASFYAYKKSNDWLKLKPIKEADVKIIGVRWGKQGKTGQMLGLIGSLKCTGVIEGKKITFHSSGMSMELRKQMTVMHNKGKLKGKIVEVHYDAITINNAVRFPRFARLRLDK